jgi:hypothetical protein
MISSLIRVGAEGIFVGLSLIVFVYISSGIVSNFNLKPSLPEICASWNQKYVMEITLFVAGFLFHVTFELLGLNKWYCANYKGLNMY